MKKGFSLIEVLLAVSIAAILSMIAAQKVVLERESYAAKKLGLELYQYGTSVSRFLAINSGLDAPSTKIGAHWLRSTECQEGEADFHYLPCQYMPLGKTSVIGMEPVTHITRSPQGELTARTVFAAYDYPTGQLASLQGEAAMVASTSDAVQMLIPATGGLFTYCPPTSRISPSIEPICQDERDVIISTITLTQSVGINLKKLIESELDRRQESMYY